MASNTPGKRNQPSIFQNHIKHLIGVTSAKGGVGKSFSTALLAVELTQMGYRVGILDADFTAPGIPTFFGISEPLKIGERSFSPQSSSKGIRIVSLDLLVDSDSQLVIWKESLMGKVIEELWKEVEWGDLDYLLIDLPPATSEAAVAITQSLPFDGCVIVTTPQEISSRFTARAAAYLRKSNVDILGTVINMAWYTNPETGQAGKLFGNSKPDNGKNPIDVPVLTRIPFIPEAVALCDSGKIEDVVMGEDPSLVGQFLKALSDILENKPSMQVLEDVSSATPETVTPEDASHTQSPVSPAHNPFSGTVMHLIRARENMGEMEDPDAQGFFLGKCGDRMQIDLRIIKNRIIEAMFVPEGCGATLACGSMLTKMACAKTLQEAEKITPGELIEALDGLPEDHLHCAELAVMTLREAVIDSVEGRGTPLM